MSNELKVNPMVIDSAGSVMTGDWHFQGIQIVPSAGNWAVILKDKNDKIIYQMSKASADGYSDFFEPILVSGLKFDTKTNVTRILIHKRNS